MNPCRQILVVDDDEGITTLLRDYLTGFAFCAHTACDGSSMRQQLATLPIDLVVLDVMLPGIDGLSLARELRQRSGIPIIMLTARTSHFDRVLGLEMGADDYMSKPFEPRELVARIHTVLRRAASVHDRILQEVGSDVVYFDGWALHRHERRLTAPSGLVVPLSNAEFRLLSSFLAAPRRLLSRDQLMEQARGRSMDAFERSIDLLVSRLRQKLSDTTQPSDMPSMIKTVRGSGYMFTAQSVQGQPGWPH
ncbi:response regulator transcription factor [Rhodoferax sp.]|uniref:response regulator n=1 Tax=Rhodoferax sp. TaxID=50421 RepID=UPI0025FFF23C|nr:response regulator transcription factor [Rhodoferax sp.]